VQLPEYAAIVLAGGRGARLGGVHKPGIVVAGRTLLDRVLAAVHDAAHVVVVGPPQPVPADAALVREEPPGGGPVAALAAGLAAVLHERAGSAGGQPEFVAVLAADLPFLTAEAVTALRAAACDHDGAVLVDADGRDQHLAGVWRLTAMDRALAELGDPAGAPMRRLVAALNPARIAPLGEPNTPAPWFDCDDPDDLTEAERWAGET
jgi:molybdopterin-guanine dinucleotide biosynthesis protein A